MRVVEITTHNKVMTGGRAVFSDCGAKQVPIRLMMMLEVDIDEVIGASKGSKDVKGRSGEIQALE